MTTPRPFDLDADEDYRAWRDRKLAERPERAADLIVEVRDPHRLTDAERTALVDRCRRANMAIYAGPPHRADKGLALALGRQLGLARLDGNWLADEDGISSLEVSGGGLRRAYIPYTNRPIRWHTDGYYHPPERRIRAMLLHCVSAAAEGGENRLMDHEIAYLLLREADPEYVRVLSAPDAMTIPARLGESEDGPADRVASPIEAAGADGADAAARVVRPDQTGPVFSVLPESGDLHMRYTARTRSIRWRDDAATRAAVAALLQLLDQDPGGYAYRLRLEPGMGIVCNNVLHDRSGFTDSGNARRLVYRARYLDRIAGTGGAWRSSTALLAGARAA